MATMITSDVTSYHGTDRDSENEAESEDEPFVPAPLSWFEHDEEQDTVPTDSPAETDETETLRAAPQNLAVPSSVVANTVRCRPQPAAIGAPLPSPSWKEISSQVLPSAARELLSSSLRRVVHTARISYSKGRWSRKYSELGNNAGGYYRSASLTSNTELPPYLQELPPFSSLPWVDRQLVLEWRTYLPDDDPENEDDDFDRARTLAPKPIQRPLWLKAEVCRDCHKPFGPTRLRHHCRLCGNSFCQPHSSYTHSLVHLGYDPEVPERVCDSCKTILLEHNLAERVAWRLARCRDYQEGSLTPYFETGVDSMEEVALRITQAALTMAKSIPLGAQATVAVETVDVLRRHGLNGIYTIMLRQEFLAAADLLRKALGINRTAWPLSVHELSAAIFYALAQHRAMRGMNPEREHLIHAFRDTRQIANGSNPNGPVELERQAKEADIYDNSEGSCVANLVSGPGSAPDVVHRGDASVEPSETRDEALPCTPVCDPVSDSMLASLIFYAPMALNFIYATKEVDMQLLAAQQGWRLLYASLTQESGRRAGKATDRPGSALFVHEGQKVVCVAVRGTATIHDVITDIRQMPVPFPESEAETSARAQTEEDWTTVGTGKGLAVCGMATAAVNLYREHIDSLLYLAKQGYRIRMTGHSLGGGVATLLGVLVLRDLNILNEENEGVEGRPSILSGTQYPVRVYAYGTPSSVDAKFADYVEPFVTTVVLHDDVIPRLNPSSCRGLLKHLLHIRETWVKDHFADDIMAITERAKTAWAPRWRGSFMMSPSPSSLKRYCRKQIQFGRRKLLSVKDKLAGESDTSEEQHAERTTDQGALDANDGGLPSEEELDSFEATCDSTDNADVGTEECEPRFLVDYIGGVDCRSQGVIIDGDEFFDTDDNLVESDDDFESTAPCHKFDTDCDTSDSLEDVPSDDDLEAVIEAFDAIKPKSVKETVPTQEPEGLRESECECNGDGDDDSPEGVILEETPLPRMFIPGKIVHLYSHRGVYKAAQVPRGFKELRRISLAGNMLLDHKSKAYYEALLEAHTVRVAQEHPPRWTAFDEDDTWYVSVHRVCCIERFDAKFTNCCIFLLWLQFLLRKPLYMGEHLR